MRAGCRLDKSADGIERAEMTVTAHPAETTTAVNAWLAEFGDALAAGDPEGAAALFAPECYWRDLVAFTWNIKTMEGRGAIAEMLQAVLPRVTPSGWRITPGEEPAEAGGVTEAWIDFETAAGRGHGHLRADPAERRAARRGSRPRDLARAP
jgi:putative flavoprotein involved in K+ transport